MTLINNVFTLILFFILTAFSAFGATVTKDSITWTFTGTDVSSGQYVTGDWYAVCPSNDCILTDISPTPSAAQGTMINPAFGEDQGYSSSALNYNASLNVGLSLPIGLSTGDIIVSTTPFAWTTADQTYIDEAAILVIVDSPPPANSFRPGYCDYNVKGWTESDLDYSVLNVLTKTANSPGATDYDDLVARPFIDHKPGEPGRKIHPHNNMPDYGSEIATRLGLAALFLQLDYTNSEKRNVLIGMVQIGIDFYSMYLNGSNWYADGGHSHGRKFPILLAGAVLGNSGMLSIGDKTGDYATQDNIPVDYRRFQEDDNTYYVRESDVTIGATTTCVSDDARTAPDINLTWDADTETFTETGCSPTGPWNPDTRNQSGDGSVVYARPYTSSMIGMPESSVRGISAPTRSDSSWSAAYRHTNTTGATIIYAPFVALTMGLKDAWNKAALFDYMDRFMAIEDGNPDPFGYSVSREGDFYNGRGSVFFQEVYDAYRGDYPYPPYNIQGVAIHGLGGGLAVKGLGDGSAQ